MHETRDAITELWQRDWFDSDDVLDVVASLLTKSSQICHDIAVEQRRRALEEEKARKRSLSSIQLLIQQNLGDLTLQEDEIRARTALTSMLERSAEFSYHSSAAFWARKGDRTNREFFQTHGQRKGGGQIRALRDPTGEVRADPDDVMCLASDFYASLFSDETCTEEVLGARQAVWSCTSSIVTDQMWTALMAPFTEIELAVAFQSQSGQKCPGEDGLSKAFFTTFWDPSVNRL